MLFAFTGRPLDWPFDIQFNLNRWYDPAVGSWLSEDPIGYEGGQNLYEYAGDDPLNAQGFDNFVAAGTTMAAASYPFECPPSAANSGAGKCE